MKTIVSAPGQMDVHSGTGSPKNPISLWLNEYVHLSFTEAEARQVVGELQKCLYELRALDAAKSAHADDIAEGGAA